MEGSTQQRASLEWKWVIVGVVVGVAIAGGSFLIVIPTFHSTPIQALVLLAGFVVTGVIVGYASPGVTIREASVAGGLVALMMIILLYATGAALGQDMLRNLLLLALGFGLSWIESGELRTRKFVGKIESHLDEIMRIGVMESTAMIGVCRLATSGTWRDERNNQPMVNAEYAVVHNGNFYNDTLIFAKYQYVPKTNCDSEAILAMLESGVRCGEEIIEEMSPRVPFAALILSREGQITPLRTEHPLFESRYPEGMYYCSRSMSGSESVEPTIDPVDSLLR